MPEGSSSAAPVINPGPSSPRNRSRPRGGLADDSDCDGVFRNWLTKSSYVSRVRDRRSYARDCQAKSRSFSNRSSSQLKLRHDTDWMPIMSTEQQLLRIRKGSGRSVLTTLKTASYSLDKFILQASGLSYFLDVREGAGNRSLITTIC